MILAILMPKESTVVMMMVDIILVLVLKKLCTKPFVLLPKTQMTLQTNLVSQKPLQSTNANMMDILKQVLTLIVDAVLKKKKVVVQLVIHTLKEKNVGRMIRMETNISLQFVLHQLN